MARAGQAPLDDVSPEQIAEAERAVRESGAVAPKKLVAARFTRRAEAELVDALVRRGLERTARWVRVPLEAQLVARLAAGDGLKVSALAKELGGATAAEAKKVAFALVRGGRAALVKDGRVERLVPVDGRTLGAEEVARLGTAAAELKLRLKALEQQLKTTRATKTRPGLSLLREVLLRFGDELRALGTTLGAPAVAPSAPAAEARRAEPAPDGAADAERVLASLKRLNSNPLGLVFVPELVRALADDLAAGAVHDALLAAAARGAVELRPESGLDRLSPEDRAACLVGPSGRLVSYVRIRA